MRRSDDGFDLVVNGGLFAVDSFARSAEFKQRPRPVHVSLSASRCPVRAEHALTLIANPHPQ
jgi:hypothetical protein